MIVFGYCAAEAGFEPANPWGIQFFRLEGYQITFILCLCAFFFLKIEYGLKPSLFQQINTITSIYKKVINYTNLYLSI